MEKFVHRLLLGKGASSQSCDGHKIVLEQHIDKYDQETRSTRELSRNDVWMREYEIIITSIEVYILFMPSSWYHHSSIPKMPPLQHPSRFNQDIKLPEGHNASSPAHQTQKRLLPSLSIGILINREGARDGTFQINDKQKLDVNDHIAMSCVIKVAKEKGVDSSAIECVMYSLGWTSRGKMADAEGV